ncbi:MAG: SDR family oxidoreductase [Chloroflexota bacterium]|nr:SDR family oxidoreductase [Chloroflexota bacterium]
MTAAKRPLGDQVVVVTGASQGIGRETALQLATHGSSVVLAARNADALGEVEREVTRIGGQAEAVATDVADWPQVERLAARAVERFGRIDTWVNNAAVSAYGTIDDLGVDEIERIVRVNLLGQVHGVKAALPHLRRAGGGTIINIGSALSERAVPLQSAYVATKHAIKGFSEAIRMELERDGSGIDVTLILPSSINTPLFSQARSYLGVRPAPVPPVYEPRVVAEAILAAAVAPRREIVVGGWGKMLVVGQRLSASLLDWYMLQGDRLFRQQATDRPDDGSTNLFEPAPGTGSTTGEFGDGSNATSLYTRHLELHPNRKRALTVAAWVAALALVRRSGARR